jgi:hypothetical protein
MGVPKSGRKVLEKFPHSLLEAAFQIVVFFFRKPLICLKRKGAHLNLSTDINNAHFFFNYNQIII